MAVLVTVASRHGSTLEIGVALGRALQDAGLEVRVQPVGEAPGLDGVTAVVLGSAAYYGKWLDEAVQFANAHAEALAALPVWLFSSGPLGWPLQPRPEDAVHVEEIVARLRPREHRVIPGELDRHKLGVVERSVVRAVHAPEGDFRDWDALEAWAAQIAAALHAEGGHT